MLLFCRFLLAAILFATSSQSHALACGETLVASTTLTTNYNCRGLPFAFKLARDGIVLNLNGKTISGGDIDGLLAFGVRGVQIRGPGRLQMSRNAIRAIDTDALIVSNVQIVGGGPNAIVLINSRTAKIERTRIDGLNGTAIDISQPTGTVSAGAGGHILRDNLISNSGNGIRICGADAGDNDIIGNQILNIANLALDISHEASRNWIESNRFRNLSSVQFNRSSENLFANNVFEPGSRGITVQANPPAGCVTRTAAALSAHNQFLNNAWYNVEAPIVLGSGAPTGLVSKNRIGGNLFVGALVAIKFHFNATDNDATGNTFDATTVEPTLDLGFRNIY